MRRLLAGLAAVAGLGGTACKDPPLYCVDTLDLTCAPLYPPTFDNVFKDTLIPECSTGGGSCHTPAGHQAGLSFDKTDPHAAYLQLLMPSSEFPDRERVAPGDPACSVLIERIYSGTDRWHMPRGKTLADNEKCAIAQWVARGADEHPPDAAPVPDAGPAIDAGVDAP